MSWRCAVLFPDSTGDWAWAERSLMGIPAVVRMLITLRRAGIGEVRIPHGDRPPSGLIEKWADKRDLPWVVRGFVENTDDGVTGLPVLLVRGGILVGTELFGWIDRNLGDLRGRQVCFKHRDGLELLASVNVRQEALPEFLSMPWRTLCSRVGWTDVEVPPQFFAESVDALSSPGGDRHLIRNLGKESELPHVGWIRNRTFPAVRWLAAKAVSPNQVTVAGFLLGLLGAVSIAAGNYWGGILGALLLCGSWILDNVDGTLARVTFSESPLGEKLDTALGHATNIAFFSALVVSVFGQESVRKAMFFCLFTVGSIVWAHWVCKTERRFRRRGTREESPKRLPVFLDQINGRDFAVLVLLFAILDGFKFFLWGSLAGLQVFWMLNLGLLMKHRRVNPSR